MVSAVGNGAVGHWGLGAWLVVVVVYDAGTAAVAAAA